MSSEQNLEEPAKRVDFLKKALQELKAKQGKIFVDLGLILREIQKDKLWKIEGYASFDSFLADPQWDVSRSTAYRVIDIVMTFLNNLQQARERIEKIEETKLLAIIPVVRKLSPTEAEVWIEKAEALSRKDLLSCIAESLGRETARDKLLRIGLSGAYMLVRIDPSAIDDADVERIGSVSFNVFKKGEEFLIKK